MVLRAAARPPGYQDMSVLEHNEAEPSPPIGASYERDRAEKFTVDEAVSSIGFGWFQVRLSLMMGFSWVGESMEVMLLSVLSPALHCAWQLSSWKQAFLTTGVFLGMMFGAMFWGWFSDKYGRKKALVTSGWFLFYFGLLSAFSPTYTWLLLLRSTMGFFIGALAQAVTLYSEFLPTKQRGSCILFLNMFWALGSALEVVLALLLMPELGWRWLLALSSVPLLMFVLFSPLIPESVRFHGACGRPDLARAAIDKMAAANGQPAPRGQLTIDDTSSERRGHVWELLSPKLWWTTLLLWCIWWCLTFCYYGVALVSTELFKLPDAELCGSIGVDQEGQVCQASCQMLSQEDYLGLLWTTLSEIPDQVTADNPFLGRAR
ncbi:synaptic vesicle 2-related protein-like [Pollicipes pollicipes]|uniref:synaptic vesicle 2-related protein-like n=1 Tax=Pollicipes pollicipes TaxID=41117 RepID=UPI0018854DF8|nr:synaptic vesicle 2-related protein-like [Pollicipes pollicipes]